MSKNSKIPESYQTVMPYLILKDAQKFIEFTEKVFNAEENKAHRHIRDENIIMHSEITIGDSTIMFADSTEAFPSRTSGLFVYVDDADDSYKKALENGARVVTGLSDQPYGRSGGVEDPCGNTWWITSVK
ncbi:MAG: VOC family protein [Bacteroidota bacterium]|nr:VOC family protein [Bacteroidota bacterium]